MAECESDTLSSVTEQNPADYYNQKHGPAMQKRYAERAQYWEADDDEVPGYRPEWRVSRRGELRVQEFNNRWRKEMYDTANHQRPNERL